jgi:DNA-binding transcriptional LysR family regulator
MEAAMDVRQLRNFLAVVDQGGFAKGASALRVAQPSLSQTIATLEKELGTRLFRRTPRGALLTTAGEALVPYARDVIKRLSAAEAAVSAAAGSYVGVINIAVMPALAGEPVGDWVARYRRRHPGMAVNLQRLDVDREAIRTELSRGSSELCISHLRGSFPGITAVKAGTERILAVFPADFAAPDDVLPLSTAATIPWIGTAAESSLRQVVDKGFAACGVTPNYVVQTRFMDSFAPLVKGGAGAALLPAQYARRMQSPGVRVLPTEPPLYREYGIYYLTGQVTPTATSFIDIALERS